MRTTPGDPKYRQIKRRRRKARLCQCARPRMFEVGWCHKCGHPTHPEPVAVKRLDLAIAKYILGQ